MNMFTSPSSSKAIQYRHVSASIDIPVRSMDFTFPDEIPEFWFSNNPLLTLLLTALSSAFPDGERQFIHSVRHYQNKIKDPILLQQVRAFIGQEAHHVRLGRHRARLQQITTQDSASRAGPSAPAGRGRPQGAPSRDTRE